MGNLPTADEEASVACTCYLPLSFRCGRLLVGSKPFLEFDMVGFLVAASDQHCHGELACCRRGSFRGVYCGPAYVRIWLCLFKVGDCWLVGSLSYRLTW
jgi:hypothetical protein